MNTDQLICVIRENACFSDKVKGVFSPDTLPSKVSFYPSAYICNTDESHLPGRHWVAFWFQSPRYAEFYDSLGHCPSYYDERFKRFLKDNSNIWKYTTKAVQTNRSMTCGYHVLFYLLMKCLDHTLPDIIGLLLEQDVPDQYVYDFISSYFDCL